MEVIRQEFTDPHFEMYGPYEEVARTRHMTINTTIFNDTNTITDHFYYVLNIFKDGIESWQVQSSKITVVFADNITVVLPLTVYWFNLIFWRFPVSTGEPVISKFLYFPNGQTQGAIKNYIDTKFLDTHRALLPNKTLNRIIDEALYIYKHVDDFSLYIMNTSGNEDTVRLMMENKEFYDCVHCSVAEVPIEDVKSEGMKYTMRGIELMKNSGYHWGEPYFKSGQGLNIKQHKEVLFNIGTKPDGNGSVFPVIIDSNFSMGALRDPVAYLIESNNGRLAQILSKNNVGTSGAFARILGLNNQDTKLHYDPKYICNTKTFVKRTMTTEQVLDRYKNRYYRLSPNGVEYKLSSAPVKDNRDLLGKTLYFRSPITCASKSHGAGICYRCYGDLAYTNSDINIGKVAAEIMSSQLTQKLLSAKHLLESAVKEMLWVEGFFEFFDVQYNLIMIREDFATKKYKIRIKMDEIEMDDEMDDFEYNEYITNFDIIDPNGAIINIHSSEMDNLYISMELNELLQKKKPDEDSFVTIEMDELKESALFLISIVNDELSATLEKVKAILNKKPEIERLGNIDNIVTSLIDVFIEGGLNVDAVHAEVLLSNQCIQPDDPLETPYWEYPNEPHKIISLNEALTNNPSVTKSLMYQKVAKALYTPLTFKKRSPSSLDLFFMTQPQNYMAMETEESDLRPENDDEITENVVPFTFEAPKENSENNTD